jgi:CRP/FNR family transcriptional regulator, dissimilatory nitrate respiration regulator
MVSKHWINYLPSKIRPFTTAMKDRFEIANLPEQLQRQFSHRQLQAGEIVFIDGDPAENIYYLESGLVRLVHYTESGQAVNHYAIMPGGFLAEVLVVVDHYLCTAVAEEPSQILVIPKQPFVNALRQDGNLLFSFLGEVAYRLHMTKMLMELRGIRLAHERVLNYFQIIAQPGTNAVILDRPFKEIARDLDLTPETFSRAMALLQEEGRISREERQITLLS